MRKIFSLTAPHREFLQNRGHPLPGRVAAFFQKSGRLRRRQCPLQHGAPEEKHDQIDAVIAQNPTLQMQSLQNLPLMQTEEVALHTSSNPPAVGQPHHPRRFHAQEHRSKFDHQMFQQQLAAVNTLHLLLLFLN